MESLDLQLLLCSPAVPLGARETSQQCETLNYKENSCPGVVCVFYSDLNSWFSHVGLRTELDY